MSRRLLQNATTIKKLAAKLQASKKIQALGQQHEQPSAEAEAGTLAHALSDLEESFDVCMNKLFPKLLQERLSIKEMEETLFEISEEFEHILYHMRDAKLFAPLFK